NASSMNQAELEAVQAKQRVAEAKMSNSFGATINASAGFNQTSNSLSTAYQSLLDKERLSVSVQMPFFQWGGGRADVEAARADQQRAESNARSRKEQLEEDARFTALGFAQTQRL